MNNQAGTLWTKRLTRALIALGSTAAFAGSWILLGHSGKPVAPGAATSADGAGGSASTSSALAPLPTLQPLDSASSDFSLQPAQPSRGFNLNPVPRLRSRGS